MLFLTIVSLVAILQPSVAQDRCDNFDVTLDTEAEENYITGAVTFHCWYDASNADSVIWKVKTADSRLFTVVYRAYPQDSFTDVIRTSAGPTKDFENITYAYFISRMNHSLTISKAGKEFQNSIWVCTVATPILCYFGLDSNKVTLKLKDSWIRGPWLVNMNKGEEVKNGSTPRVNDVLNCSSTSEPKATISLMGTALGFVNDMECLRTGKGWLCYREGVVAQQGTVTCTATLIDMYYEYDCQEGKCASGIFLKTNDAGVTSSGVTVVQKLSVRLLLFLLSLPTLLVSWFGTEIRRETVNLSVV